jgi:hypothetical protein
MHAVRRLVESVPIENRSAYIDGNDPDMMPIMIARMYDHKDICGYLQDNGGTDSIAGYAIGILEKLSSRCKK